MFGGFFYVLFSGSYLSAHAMQGLSVHSISGNGRKPVKKIIPNHATLLLTMKPEVESPLNRICISYNRRGHRTFAVFLLPFFYRNVPQGCFRCWLPFAAFPIWILAFSKISDWRKKEWHTTTDGRTENGLSGKKPKEKFTGAWS